MFLHFYLKTQFIILLDLANKRHLIHQYIGRVFSPLWNVTEAFWKYIFEQLGMLCCFRQTSKIIFFRSLWEAFRHIHYTLYIIYYILYIISYILYIIHYISYIMHDFQFFEFFFIHISYSNLNALNFNLNVGKTFLQFHIFSIFLRASVKQHVRYMQSGSNSLP